ncbi:MAG: PilN domain-containing protein [Sulfuritalea sp.]|nr:PilN domain-containing protein [Sulfuritalea sp.]
MLLLAAGLGAGVLSWAEYRTANEELANRIHTLESAQRATRPTHAAPLPNTDPQHMNRVLERLTLPWEGFFDALESAAVEYATLIAITPDTARGSVQIRGEARDIGVVVYYVSKLESGGFFRDVDLVEHERGTQNADLPLRFLITARWTPAVEKP